ncbi:DDE-type integrase/transposase/recombinase [Brevibacillus thermoruber]|uniref:DDE-type integrase/transposase/recombinase n=1 Tax=Brevibacillus thermoruber TaxID=33942 RepID=UPI0009DEEFC6
MRLKPKRKTRSGLEISLTFPLQHGFLYLATYLDGFSRKVVGWAMNTRMTEQLVIDAFLQAVGRERPSAGLIVHTDRGSQYTSRRYQSTLAAHGAILSMSRSGDPYDNDGELLQNVNTRTDAGNKKVHQ